MDVKPIARLIVPFVCLAAGCNSHDDNYIPYRLKAMDAWVYDNRTDTNHYAGRATANYLSRDKGLSQCQSLAFSVASQMNLQDWGYVCCTVTSESDCVTKVR